MKIICVDNFDRNTQADVLVAEKVHPYYIKDLVAVLNLYHSGDFAPHFFIAVEDDRVLFTPEY